MQEGAYHGFAGSSWVVASSYSIFRDTQEDALPYNFQICAIKRTILDVFGRFDVDALGRDGKTCVDLVVLWRARAGPAVVFGGAGNWKFKSES